MDFLIMYISALLADIIVYKESPVFLLFIFFFSIMSVM